MLAPVQLVSRVIQMSGGGIGGKGLFSVELKCKRKRKGQQSTLSLRPAPNRKCPHYNAILSTSTSSKFTAPPIVSKEMPSEVVAGNIRSEITTWPSPP